MGSERTWKNWVCEEKQKEYFEKGQKKTEKEKMQVRSTCAPRTRKWISMSYFLIEVKMLVEKLCCSGCRKRSVKDDINKSNCTSFLVSLNIFLFPLGTLRHSHKVYRYIPDV